MVFAWVWQGLVYWAYWGSRALKQLVPRDRPAQWGPGASMTAAMPESASLPGVAHLSGADSVDRVVGCSGTARTDGERLPCSARCCSHAWRGS